MKVGPGKKAVEIDREYRRERAEARFDSTGKGRASVTDKDPLETDC